MYPLIETIKIVDGTPQNLKWHQKRVDYSFRKYYDADTIYQLSEMIAIPENCRSGIIKARFLYSNRNFRVEFKKYEIQDIQTLKLIHSDNIDYSIKFTDRTKLIVLFNRRGDCDDILIVKNGQITDTSYCNIIFFDGSKWFTPVSPLLRGTCRERLIHEKKILESEITINQLDSFSCFKLVNAMRDFDEVNEIPVSAIHV